MLFFPLVFLGQSFTEVQDVFTTSLKSIKDSNTGDNFAHFAALNSKRDLISFKNRFDSIEALSVFVIEGYNFNTGKYSVFEQYNFSPISERFGECRAFLDGKELKGNAKYTFNFDSSLLFSKTIAIDSIWPRKYRYGTGCVETKREKRLANKLRQQAKEDGIVTEPYCKIETFIFKNEKKIFTKYFFPIAGERQTEIRSGMLSEWPAGLDYWLFVTSNFTGDE